ncbi:type I glutamate--ammonia ligase [Candidatus Woesearchaeota archaeon]|nr:type I glutamate--ammonia ligase [Candidatus Woesearchaeota archaeon]
MTEKELTPEEVLEKVKADNVHFMNLQFSDILGAVKSLTIPVRHLETAFKYGIWFDGSSIQGFMRICESDMVLKPDASTYAVIPWLSTDEQNTARIICDVCMPDGAPFEGDPRFILRKILKEAEAMGYIYNTGPELEFFILKNDSKNKENGNYRDNNNKIEPLSHDVGGYFDLNLDKAYEIRRDIVNALEKFGIEVEASHHEVAEGQHEIDFKYGPALRTADNALTFKFTVKAIAEKHGVYATFMPKPIFRINGSGMHVHQSLFDKNGNNVFYDEKDKYKLSKIAYGFIAGQLAHIKAIAAITSPTVNSYKRLVPGYEAPVYICWGQINRSALIRIPRYTKGKELSTRAELRCPDPSCNPYLAFAVMLKAGLEGIKKNMLPPASVEENVYHFDDSKLKELNIDTLPYSLQQALKELKNDEVVKDALGKYTYEKYVEAKLEEWDEFRIYVTDWEIERYLKML